ncbi:acyl-homoserine-lactone synthase [Acidiphilium iwatense]|uniref:Acyl-homoserine-lactone synthase n=1 Tax=Acidiphilium iwatense TaxID=768198 RepID=A0ABS9DYZ1_9PROT|nr:acyl-homoserine-lactone synthase [Acidiphilium iwatense]MCF3947970.1 hypothetical protein [Acidiphilium iwatense]
MLDIITGANRGQFARQLDSMFEDRKRVFVDLFKWNLPVSNGRFEIDQFDDTTAVYLLITDQNGDHRGSLRLLRADRPHLLGSVFPDLCEHGVPADSCTAEITRLCLSPRLPAVERLHIRNQLITAMVDYALAHGIQTFTGVVSARFLSRILAMGWRCEVLGSPRIVNGSMIGAFRIDIDEATPHRLRATGIYSATAIGKRAGVEPIFGDM